MKAERIKIAASERSEIHVRYGGGRLTLYVVGPATISVTRQAKK
jgi:hypothetical protein